MNTWIQDATVYHLFPLGSTGAPARNDFSSPPSQRLNGLHDWLPYLSELGVDTLLLGPVLESSAHGYDTADLYHLDRRLGTDDDFRAFVAACHERGLRVVLDAVFHHVGRDFWAFRDVQRRGAQSAYCNWFFLDFSGRSPAGDDFAYEGWDGHFDLVKLNTDDPGVRAHLLDAARLWLGEFGVDGLRLDAADVLALDFQLELAQVCRSLKPDCWLLGEVVHGDYRRWANPDTLDGTTNYELYKGLYSSHNDRNLFEVAYALQREFGAGGLYRDLPLLNFADNHDVPRLASILHDAAHLTPLYLLLLTVPGVPSLYYGSEWGVRGKKAADSDAPLRPALTPAQLPGAGTYPDLYPALRKLIRLRQDHAALRHGAYHEQHVASEQLAFTRELAGETILVAVNISPDEATLQLSGLEPGSVWHDILDPGSDERVSTEGRLELALTPNWGRVLRRRP